MHQVAGLAETSSSMATPVDASARETEGARGEGRVVEDTVLQSETATHTSEKEGRTT